MKNLSLAGMRALGGSSGIGAWLAKDLVSAFVQARFSSDETFRRRVAKLNEMDAAQ